MLHVATDVEEYAEHTKKVLISSLVPPKPSTANEEKQGMFSSSSSRRRPPQTAAESAAAGKEDGLEHPEARHTRAVVEEQIPREETNNGAHRRPWQQQQQQAEGETECKMSCRVLSDEVSARWEGGETAERPSWRPLTIYEEKAREAGRRVRDFSYRLELLPAASNSPPFEQ